MTAAAVDAACGGTNPDEPHRDRKKRVLTHLAVSIEERAGNLIKTRVARGTAHLRTHVDIGLESRLVKLDGVLGARERHGGRASLQIVALPQSGVMRCPGVLDQLDAAVREGADLIRGIDPLEIDRNGRRTNLGGRSWSPPVALDRLHHR